MRGANTRDPFAEIKSKLLRRARISVAEVETGALDPAIHKRLYDALMRQYPESQVTLPDELLTTLLQKRASDPALLFNPADFGRSDTKDLAIFFTSRCRSKLSAFNSFANFQFDHQSRLIVLPVVTPQAYVCRHSKIEYVVIHYGLLQVIEFIAEQDVLSAWIG